MTRTYKTEGVILKRSNLREADRLVTIFTRYHGKVRVRAPGIRKTQSHKSAHLELFNLSGLFLAQGKSLDIVTEAQTLNNFASIRKDLQKVWVAYYFCELVDSLCAERQENREVFELLKKSLEELSSLNNYNDFNFYKPTDDFANQLLQILGYLPRDKSLSGGDLERFIENILERSIKSKKLLRNK